MSMFAHLCLIAWKLPMGRPNCTRSLAYSTLISMVASAMPSSSLESRMAARRSEEHTSELQSRGHLVCRLLLEKKNIGIPAHSGIDSGIEHRKALGAARTDSFVPR